jgi:myo-inositol-1(or 4)-monophosphatase
MSILKVLLHLTHDRQAQKGILRSLQKDAEKSGRAVQDPRRSGKEIAAGGVFQEGEEMMSQKEFAIDLARKAGAIIKTNFSLGMKKEWKKDGTPLTETDKAVNRLVLEEIHKSYPDHAILSEEGGLPFKSEYVWVCDPMDGTTPFSHGYPTFAFSLALTKNGESILGVIYDPIMDRLAFAERGKGAFLNEQKMKVSAEPELTGKSFVHLDCDYKLAPLRDWLIKNKDCYAPTIYSSVYVSLLVAAGEFSGEVFEYRHPWDGAAVKVIVEEAGGKVTDILGKEQRYDREINGFIAANSAIHKQLVDAISSILGAKKSSSKE